MQKDSHTLYLEQELESLKVVVEIKNNQLHQKEKKLMEMDKLVSNIWSVYSIYRHWLSHCESVFYELTSNDLLQVETNVKLEECLKKVQQENEDYKARMDKHAALSKYVAAMVAQLLQHVSVGYLMTPSTSASCPHQTWSHNQTKSIS